MGLGGLFPNQVVFSPIRELKVRGEHESTCVYYGAEGTMEHRVFTCPVTDHLRVDETWHSVRKLPCCRLFGSLSPKVASSDEYKESLQPLQHGEIYPASESEPPYTFFTDGPALDNDNDDLRLCSWAVTRGLDDGPANEERYLGLLPGNQQSVFRAELYGMLQWSCVFLNSGRRI